MTPTKTRPEEIWGFQFRPEGRGWTIGNGWALNGDGLSSADRKALRPWIAGQALIDALEREPAFWNRSTGFGEQTTPPESHGTRPADTAAGAALRVDAGGCCSSSS
jgi:hypothetical protein